MMRLEPAHRLLVGVNGASLVSVPLAVLLLFFVYLVPKHGAETGRAVSPPLPSSAAPVPSVVSEAPRQRQQTIMPAKKAPAVRVLYSVRWTGGEIRRKIAGSIPHYPAGFSGEAMSRVELVVSAPGNVRSAKLLQIGNPLCDEVTLRDARLWKFQPLPPRQKRADQHCVLIVSFTRK
jgi:outer membrane biosynthesis protein TonB